MVAPMQQDCHSATRPPGCGELPSPESPDAKRPGHGVGGLRGALPNFERVHSLGWCP